MIIEDRANPLAAIDAAARAYSTWNRWGHPRGAVGAPVNPLAVK